MLVIKNRTKINKRVSIAFAGFFLIVILAAIIWAVTLMIQIQMDTHTTYIRLSSGTATTDGVVGQIKATGTSSPTPTPSKRPSPSPTPTPAATVQTPSPKPQTYIYKTPTPTPTTYPTISPEPSQASDSPTSP